MLLSSRFADAVAHRGPAALEPWLTAYSSVAEIHRRILADATPEDGCCRDLAVSAPLHRHHRSTRCAALAIEAASYHLDCRAHRTTMPCTACERSSRFRPRGCPPHWSTRSEGAVPSRSPNRRVRLASGCAPIAAQRVPGALRMTAPGWKTTLPPSHRYNDAKAGAIRAHPPWWRRNTGKPHTKADPSSVPLAHWCGSSGTLPRCSIKPRM